MICSVMVDEMVDWLFYDKVDICLIVGFDCDEVFLGGGNGGWYCECCSDYCFGEFRYLNFFFCVFIFIIGKVLFLVRLINCLLVLSFVWIDLWVILLEGWWF